MMDEASIEHDAASMARVLQAWTRTGKDGKRTCRDCRFCELDPVNPAHMGNCRHLVTPVRWERKSCNYFEAVMRP